MERKTVVIAATMIALVVISTFAVYEKIVNNQLTSENSRKDSVIKDLQGIIVDNGTTIDALHRIVEAAENKLQNSTVIIKELNRTVQDLRNKLQKSNITIDTLNKIVEDLHGKLLNTTATVEESKRIIEDLKSKIQVSDTTIDQLQKTVENLNSKLLNNTLTIKDLTATIEALNKELNALKTAQVKADLETIFHGHFWPWDTDYHEVKGRLTNYGINKAKNILVILYWTRQGKTFHTETMEFNEIGGRFEEISYIEIAIGFYFNNEEDNFGWQIFYDSQ